MLNKLMKTIFDKKFIRSGNLAIIALILFQLMLCFAIVFPNDNNLLPIRHEIKINTLRYEPIDPSKGTELKLVSHAEDAGYQTDSVEIVKDHFFNINITKLRMGLFLALLLTAVFFFKIFRRNGIYICLFLLLTALMLIISDLNIVMQLLALSFMAIVFFAIFQRMDILPTPFLLPLFIILTISIFYHNYLGTHVIDKVSVPLESVLCSENCDSKENKNIATIPCNVERKLGPWIIKKDICENIIPGNVIEKKDDAGNTIKKLKIDKQKMKIMKDKVSEAKALEFYSSNDKRKIEELKSDHSDSNINKYKRASNDSKNHFLYLLGGLLCFLAAMIFAKLFSKVKNFSDYKFWGLIGLVIVGGVCFALLEKFAWNKAEGVTSLGEFLKLSTIFLTVVGYEKINTRKLNLVLYIVALFFGIAALVVLNDFGNMIILSVVVWLVFLVVLPWKKIFLIAFPLLAVVSLICLHLYIYNFNHNMSENWRVDNVDNKVNKVWGKNSNMMWRFPDALISPDGWTGVKNPVYQCRIQVVRNNERMGLNQFYSIKSEHEMCIKTDENNKEIIGLNMLKNCKVNKEGIRTCNLNNENGFSNFSKADDSGNLTCAKDNYIKCDMNDKDQDKTFCKCNQINTDARLAMFAMLKDGLKDGLAGGPTGFKENTFILNNKYMYTDFVFLGLIAFFGLWLTLVVAACLIILIFNCSIEPRQCGNNYKHFLYSNIMVVILATQAIIHIGGTLNITPFTGVILPFLSRGGFGTIVSFTTLGFALGGLVSDEFMNNVVNCILETKLIKYILKLTKKSRKSRKSLTA